MQTSEILAAIDEEISHLQQARALLAAGGQGPLTGKRRGRPKGSVNKAANAGTSPASNGSGAAGKPTRSRMSPEGKARIAAAQKARWAAQRKSISPAGKKGAGPGKKTGTAKKAAGDATKPVAKRGRPSKQAIAERAAAAKIASATPEGSAEQGTEA